jgi:hypothetical protein
MLSNEIMETNEGPVIKREEMAHGQVRRYDHQVVE